MSQDDAAVSFVMTVSGEFRDHALAVIGGSEPLVVPGATWTEDGVVLEYLVEPGALLPNRVSRDAVLALLARTYKRRSSRVLWGEWLMPGIPDNFQDLLEQRFRVFRRSGLEIGPGWFDMLWALGEWLEEVDPDRDAFMQVKEKFGGLRAYGPVTDAGEPIVEAAEFLSFQVCDMCGKPGTNRDVRGLWATRCDEHRHV